VTITLLQTPVTACVNFTPSVYRTHESNFDSGASEAKDLPSCLLQSEKQPLGLGLVCSWRSVWKQSGVEKKHTNQQYEEGMHNTK